MSDEGRLSASALRSILTSAYLSPQELAARNGFEATKYSSLFAALCFVAFSHRLNVTMVYHGLLIRCAARALVSDAWVGVEVRG